MGIIDQLLIVQEFDCRIREIEKELEDIPHRKEEEKKRLEAHRQALAKAEQDLKSKQAEIKRFELESQARQENITKLRRQQYEIKTNKEFKVLEDEIKAIQKDIAGLEDRELGIMEAVEDAAGDVKARAHDLKAEDAAVQGDIQAWDGRIARIETELKDLSARRAKSVEGIPQPWLSHYEKVLTRRDKALVPVEDGVCGGCHMRVTPSVANNARKQTSVVTCDYCARMLYFVGSIGGTARSPGA